ncbi:hypothetical protein Hanom_Chr07g00660761 [Helianthus anomalus]
MMLLIKLKTRFNGLKNITKIVYVRTQSMCSGPGKYTQLKAHLEIDWRGFGCGLLKVQNFWRATHGYFVLGGVYISTSTQKVRINYFLCKFDRLDEYMYITQINARFFCSPRRGCMVSYFWSPKHVLGMLRGNAPMRL